MLDVKAYFHTPTNSVTYLVCDPHSKTAAVIDPVLDFDLSSGRVWTDSIDNVLADCTARGLTLLYSIETHIHADHLSAGAYVCAKTKAQNVASAATPKTQSLFEEMFEAACPPGCFDRLLATGESLHLGDETLTAIATPGHTLSCMTLDTGHHLFVGDTLFMPDYGTPRCDFPGGDVRTLFASIKRLYALDGERTVYTAHDYGAPGRDAFAWSAPLSEHRAHNVHLSEKTDEAAFVAMRTARDKTLAVPKLMFPAVQVNICGGQLPAASERGQHFLRIPLTVTDNDIPTAPQ